MGASASKENEPAALEFIESTLAAHPVTIFSKSYCPYCTMAKDVMRQAGVPYHVVELDQKSDDLRGVDIQAALATKTGRTTVPNVFIKNVSVGGGTDVRALFQSGKLIQMLKEADVLA